MARQPKPPTGEGQTGANGNGSKVRGRYAMFDATDVASLSTLVNEAIDKGRKAEDFDNDKLDHLFELRRKIGRLATASATAAQ